MCAVLGYYAILSYSLLAFFFFLLGTLEPWRWDRYVIPETSVNNYHTTPRNVPEERRSHQYRGGSLKSRLKQYLLMQGLNFTRRWKILGNVD
jgi:hypothetical protein